MLTERKLGLAEKQTGTNRWQDSDLMIHQFAHACNKAAYNGEEWSPESERWRKLVPEPAWPAV